MKVYEVEALRDRIAGDKPVVLTAVNEALTALQSLAAPHVQDRNNAVLGDIAPVEQALQAAGRAIAVLARSVGVTSQALVHAAKAAKQEIPAQRMVSWCIHVGGMLYAVAEGPDGVAEHPEGSALDEQTGKLARESAQKIAAEHPDSVVTVVREITERTKTEVTL
jgi:hypothetical protein